MKRTHKEKGLNIFVNRFLGSIKRIQCVGQTGYIKIKKANFPDRYFRKYIKENFDKDRDGILSSDEINNITNIGVVRNQNITSLQGIEHFPNLMSLTCVQTGITELDVSKNTALTSLDCYDNKELTRLILDGANALTTLNCYSTGITELDVSNNTALTNLDCSNTGITELDVSKNTALRGLTCWNTGITELDVSKNTALTWLGCSNTRITSLDVSKNTELTALYCDSIGITELDVSKNTALTDLWCYNTGITELDVSKNTALTELWLDNTGITSLDVSKNTELKLLIAENNDLAWFNIGDNQNLYVSIDDSNIDLGEVVGTFNIEEVFPGIELNRITMKSGAILDKTTGIVSNYVNGTPIRYSYDCSTSFHGAETLEVTLTFHVDM